MPHGACAAFRPDAGFALGLPESVTESVTGGMITSLVKSMVTGLVTVFDTASDTVSDTGLNRRAGDSRTRTGKQYDAAASRPMPQKDVQHERENAFID
jgi:hypothetical protein